MVYDTGSASTIDGWFQSDNQFHHLYPKNIQALAKRHWTPLNISRMVLEFLVPYPGVRILDIGSGPGKFVLAGAYYKPEASFFGIEQRTQLVSHAELAGKVLGLKNAHFFQGNFTQLNFRQFDHFYFYNSFYENLTDSDKIDDSIKCSSNLFDYYTRALYRKLEEMPAGTRVATFHCLEGNFPSSYQLIEEQIGCLLKFWMKI